MLKLLCIFAVILVLQGEAKYYPISDYVTTSWSHQKVRLPFSGSTFVDLLKKTQVSITNKEKRLKGMIGHFDSLQVLDFDTSTLDSVLMTRAKSAVVVNVTLGEFSAACARMRGSPPTPGNPEEFLVLNSMLKKVDSTYQVVDLKLEGSQLVFQNGIVFDSNPAFIGGLELSTAASATTQKTIADFISTDAKSLMVYMVPVSPSVTPSVGFATTTERKAVKNQICLIDRPLSDIIFRNTKALASEFTNLLSASEVFSKLLSNFITMVEKSALLKEATTLTSSNFPIPLWLQNSRDLLSVLHSYEFTSSDIDVEFLIGQVMKSISELSQEVTNFNKGFVSLDTAKCQISEKSPLDCITTDPSKIWHRLDFYPLPVGNYKLNFDHLVYPTGQLNWASCMTSAGHGLMRILNDLCCQELRINSDDAVKYCPSAYESSSSQVILFDKIISYIGSGHAVSTFCGLNRTTRSQSTASLTLTDCSLEYNDGNFKYSVVNQGGSMDVGNHQAQSVDLLLGKKDLILATLVGILATLLLIMFLYICRACVFRCLPNCVVNLVRCLTFDCCQACPQYHNYDINEQLDDLMIDQHQRKRRAPRIPNAPPRPPSYLAVTHQEMSLMNTQ